MTAYPVMTHEKLLPLVAIKHGVALNPDYISAAPWPATIKKTVRDLFGPVEAPTDPVPAEKLDDPAVWADVASKTAQLYRRLEALAAELDYGDVAEKITVVKAQAGLLERLIVCGEKAVGLKANTEFKAAVLAALDEASPDLRTAVMAALEARS